MIPDFFSSAIVCPYCLEPVKEKDIVTKCNRNGHLASATNGRRLQRCTIKGCNGIYNVLTCPECSRDLPTDIFDYKKYIRFSIVGTSGAGKTCFITAMMEEFRNAGLGLVPSPINEETNIYYSDNRNNIYRDHLLPPANVDGKVTSMQWRILDKSKMTRSFVPPYSLTMFDGAGEDQVRMDDTLNRYISGSKSIMFLIDPMLLPNVRASLSTEDVERSTGARVIDVTSGELVSRMADYIRMTRAVRTGKRIKTPVAVIFPKVDALRSLFSHSRIFEPSEHFAQRAFVEAESVAVHNDVKGWLEGAGETALIDELDVNFVKWRFFAVSAFGNPPSASGKLMPPTPIRILDPLLWVLSEEGIVKTRT